MTTPFTESEERQSLREAVFKLTSGYGREYVEKQAREGGRLTELWKDMGKHGYLGVNIPEEYGGGGGGIGDLAAVLEENNDRDWFAANKSRFESAVRDPFLRFIADFAAPLGSISSSFRADPKPSGGSLFRIYRDIRFSKDKSPYKTHVAASFSHGDAGKERIILGG